MSQHLSQEAIDHYHSHGYCVSPIIFEAPEIEKIRNAFSRIYANELDNNRTWPFVPPVIPQDDLGIRTALFSAYVSDVIYAAVQHPALISMAATLLGTQQIRLWQDQAIWKPGSAGKHLAAGNIGFHQDYAYWQDSSTTNMVSANIALQDVTISNGALQVFPGSHQFGLFADSGDFFNTDIDALRSEYQRNVAQQSTSNQTAAAHTEPQVIELRAGQVSFHHSLTVHGSGPNTSSQPRLVLAPAYMPEGTFYRQEGQPPCPHSNFLGDSREHGTKYDGPHFPAMPV